MGGNRFCSKRCKKNKLFDDIFLQPWLLDPQTAMAIRGLIPRNWFHRMQYYFDDWGCMVCGRRNVIHRSNGMCNQCIDRVRRRLITALRKRHCETAAEETAQPSPVLDRVISARALLADLIPMSRRSTIRMRLPRSRY